MLKSLFGLAPQSEPDGSWRPSKVALMLATSATTDYAPQNTPRYEGRRRKIVVLLTEQKNMTMQNGRVFSTGNHPVETFVPMLHLQNAGFEFLIATPTGKSAAFEMWAMPEGDKRVMDLYRELLPRLSEPSSVAEVLRSLPEQGDEIAAVFVPGGHGAMLGIPQDEDVGRLLRWAKDEDRFTISICHGPGALLSTGTGQERFAYEGYEMAVFPDAMDKKTPMIGYLPGHMPWELCASLKKLDVKIVNQKPDDTCCVDRKLITGASPAASNKLGILATAELLR